MCSCESRGFVEERGIEGDEVFLCIRLFGGIGFLRIFSYEVSKFLSVHRMK